MIEEPLPESARLIAGAFVREQIDAALAAAFNAAEVDTAILEALVLCDVGREKREGKADKIVLVWRRSPAAPV